MCSPFFNSIVDFSPTVPHSTPDIPDELIPFQVEADNIIQSISLQSPPTVTRYGRVIKPPQKYRDYT